MDSNYGILLLFQSIFVHFSSTGESLRQSFLKTLFEDQGCCVTLPPVSPSYPQPYGFYSCPVASPDRVVFMEHLNPQMRAGEGVLFPIPINAIIVPIFNLDDTLLSHQDILSVKQHLEMSSIAHSESPLHNLPIVVICLNYPGSKPFADFSDPYWWIPRKYRPDAILKPDLLRIVKIIELPSTNLNMSLMTDVLKSLNIPLVEPINPIHPSELMIPSLHNALIQHCHMGIGEGVSEGFVADCIRSWIPQDISFRIWVDAALVPPISRSDRLDILWDRVRSEGYGLSFDGLHMPVASATIKPKESAAHNPFSGKVMDFLSLLFSQDEKLLDVELYETNAAYHAYVEYDTMAYDSCRFNQPLPITEYQSRMKAVWREHFHVNSSTTISEALSALAGLVHRAKRNLA